MRVNVGIQIVVYIFKACCSIASAPVMAWLQIGLFLIIVLMPRVARQVELLHVACTFASVNQSLLSETQQKIDINITDSICKFLGKRTAKHSVESNYFGKANQFYVMFYG